MEKYKMFQTTNQAMFEVMAMLGRAELAELIYPAPLIASGKIKSETRTKVKSFYYKPTIINQ